MLKNIFCFLAIFFLVSAQELKEQGIKDQFGESFYIGVAVNSRQVSGNAPIEVSLVKTHFNSI